MVGSKRGHPGWIRGGQLVGLSRCSYFGVHSGSNLVIVYAFRIVKPSQNGECRHKWIDEDDF